MNPETKENVTETEETVTNEVPESGLSERADAAEPADVPEPVDSEEPADAPEPVDVPEPVETEKLSGMSGPADGGEQKSAMKRSLTAKEALAMKRALSAKQAEASKQADRPRLSEAMKPLEVPKPAEAEPAEEAPKKRKLFAPLRFFFRHWFVHLWLLLDAAGIGYFYYYHEDRARMNELAVKYTRPIQAKLGQWSSQTSLSVMEILTVALAFLVIAYLFWFVISVLADSGRRLRRLYSNLMTGVCFAGFLLAAALLLWGTNFWTDNFQDQSGLRAQPVSTEDLKAVTTYFARALSYVSTSVERDQAGRFAVKREDILADAPTVYDNAEAAFPCLEFDDVGVKAMTFSRLMSALGYTGFYCAYTGEANVNVDSPACLLPANIAHEMAHQRGFASEQECNFLAVLACVTSGKPDYVYSGYLMGYIYLGSALYAADPDAYWSIRRRLPECVVADLAQNNTYWDQFRDTKVQEVSNQVYDKVLKTYGDERGMQSYGDMVDLLAAYWLPALQAAGETA